MPNKVFTSQVFRDAGWPLSIMRIPSHHTTPDQHGHDFDELVIIVDGVGRHMVGNETYPLEAGDVFVVLGDTTHGYAEADNLYLINVLYDPDNLGIPKADLGSMPGYHTLFTIEPTMRRQQKFKNRLRLSADELAHAVQIVAEIEEEMAKRKRGYRFVCTAGLMRLIAYLSRCYSQLQMDEKRPVTQIGELLGYMERHYNEPLTVEDLLDIAHMSQTSLMRSFKQILGRSPIDYLIQLRISKSRHLLRRTDLSIGDIAEEVGFPDSNYFARQFRKVTGKSPRQFRKDRAW